MLVVKTLERAVADGDDIKAVIRGVGISSDGKGKSLWAPARGRTGRSHSPRVWPRCLDRRPAIHRNARHVDAGRRRHRNRRVHDGVRRATCRRTQAPRRQREGERRPHARNGRPGERRARPCWPCSTESFRRRSTSTTPNEKIDWPNIPFYVPQQPLEWPEPAAGKPRRAAVNAFGIGGLNVHVVLDRILAAALPTPSTPATRGVAGREPRAQTSRSPSSAWGPSFPVLTRSTRCSTCCATGSDQKHDVELEPVDAVSSTSTRPKNSSGACRLRHGGFVTDFVYDWKKHKVPPKQIADADPLQFMLLDAADQALRDAGLHGQGLRSPAHRRDRRHDFRRRLHRQAANGPASARVQGDADRSACDAAASPKPTSSKLTSQYEDVLLKHAPALIDETGSFTSSTLASRITKTFDLMGGAVAVDAGDTSAFAALNSCIDLLRAGDCDMMLCAAGQMALDLLNVCVDGQVRLSGRWATRGARSTPARAAASRAKASACVVLKRLSDAQRDGDRSSCHHPRHRRGARRVAARKASARPSNAVSKTPMSTPAKSLSSNRVRSAFASRDLQEFDGLAAAYGRELARRADAAGRRGRPVRLHGRRFGNGRADEVDCRTQDASPFPRMSISITRPMRCRSLESDAAGNGEVPDSRAQRRRPDAGRREFVLAVQRGLSPRRRGNDTRAAHSERRPAHDRFEAVAAHLERRGESPESARERCSTQAKGRTCGRQTRPRFTPRRLESTIRCRRIRTDWRSSPIVPRVSLKS